MGLMAAWTGPIGPRREEPRSQAQDGRVAAACRDAPSRAEPATMRAMSSPDPTSTDLPDADAPIAPDANAPDAPDAPDAFAALGVSDPLLAALTTLGYEEPTPIQREAIPLLLAGRDLLAEAPTGTGKTAAFALPTLQRIEIGRAAPGSTSALIVVPTRELAMQVAEAITKYGRPLGARVVPVYGGQPISQQLRSLRRGVDVVVATPGRAVDHLKRGSLSFDAVQIVVLDEADEMLDMGFAEDLDVILGATPPTRQTALFSATISPTITKIAKRHLREPARVTVRAEQRTGDRAALVRQSVYVVRRVDKLAALCRILDVEDPASTLVFARTRGEVDDLAEALTSRGHDAGALHGGLPQEARDRIMGRFRDGSLDVLVATDVAARGLDIEHVSHVVNYDVPPDPDQYVHRIGRTGRAGREGVAITLVEPREHRLLRNIEAATRTRLQVERLPSVADLRERRLEILRANLHEALVEGGHERLRGVVEPLTDEFDLVDIALAAVSLIEGAELREEDEVELTTASFGAQPGTSPRPPLRGRPSPGGWVPQGGGQRGPRGNQAGPGGPGGGAGPEPGWAQLWIGGGRRAGLRPGDLVGSIANEAGVPGSVVGAIRIFDDFALVDVQPAVADAVAQALRGATIRGKKLPVRRERT